MNNFNKYAAGAILSLTSIFISLSANAETMNQTKCDSKVLACGTAQIAANNCINEASEATSGLFGALASKITSSDMGKTGANAATGQAASKLCQDKIDAGNAACGLKVVAPPAAEDKK